MVQAFTSLLSRNAAYLTVRWIDASGQERARVDWDAQRQLPVVRSSLSNRQGRYYFREALQTPPGQTYISALDLQEEQGHPVHPPVPTYRVGRRVFGVHGEDRGLVLINVAARLTLDRMARHAGPIQDRLMLLNGRGEWLHSPDPRDEWAHLLGGPDSFGARHPAAWASIGTQAQGQRQQDGALWTWSTVDLAQRDGERVRTQEVWKVVSRLPPEVLAATRSSAWLALLLLVSALAAYQMARVRVLREAARRDRDASRTAQQRLQAQENFHIVFEANSSGLVVVDPSGQIVMANHEALRMFGYAADELVGQPLARLLPASVEAQHGAWLAHYFNHPSKRRMGQGRALSGRRKDGQAITLEIGLSHFRDGDNEFALANVTDITARVQAEQLQHYRNTVLRLLVEGAALTQVLTAIVTGIEDISRGALCSILLLAPDSQTLLLGAAPSLPDDYNRAIHGLKIGEGVGACGTAAFRRERVIAEDLLTDPFWAPFRDLVQYAGLRACWSQPILDSRHAVLGTFAIYQREPGMPRQEDMARIQEAAHLAALAIERHHSEDALSRYRDHLEELVEERSLEIRTLNTELEQRVREAEEASRAKGDFLATMSHEIRTPMNAIIGLTNLTLKTPLNPTQADHLHKVMRSARLLLNIINDVLDLSRIEAGRMSIEAHVFELDTVLDTLSSQLVEPVSRKQLELLFDMAPDVPTRLIGDELRLGQILLNLGSNAVKFTDRGEVVVRARVATREGDDVTLRFEVQDTGIGLAPAQCERLFQSFVQADNSISRRYGGTGLGLAISRQLTQLMGGEIGVDSAPGQGSTFWFTVRMKAMTGELRRLPLSPDLRHLRVLVADDNASAGRFMQTLLERLSFNVTVVPGGAQALQALQEAEQQGQPYALLVLDWVMPEVGGEAVARRLPGLGQQQLPPFVVVCGLDAANMAQQARQLGAADVLQKPVTGSSLFDAVLAAMACQPDTKPPRSTESAAEISAIAGARVLLVEDNLLNQEVALAFLGEARLQVDVAGNGREAIEKVQQAPYDLVLMDMQLPEVDGLAATRAIRQLPGLGELPIVAMTANAMEGDRERCLQAGMNDHIPKPIDPQVLLTKLLQWIPHADRRPPSAVQPRGAVAPEHPIESPERPESPAGSPLAALASLPGLDTALGLSRAGQRTTLYLHILRRFAQEQSDTMTRLEDALAQGDRPGAERLAHTLKGLAAQIGAEALAQAAQALEKTLREPGKVPPGRAQLDAVQALLGPLARQLHQALDTPTAAQTASAHGGAEGSMGSDVGSDVDREWPALKAALMAQLHDGQGAVLQRFKDHEPLIRQALGTQHDALRQALGNFDFDAALALLAATPPLADADPTPPSHL